MPKLSTSEVQQRLQKLYNYEKILYPQIKERYEKNKVKFKELKSAYSELEKEHRASLKQMEKVLLELEELREMVYGKKQYGRKRQAVSLALKDKRKGEKPVPRPSASYRRPRPEEITGEIRFNLPVCPDCGEVLTQRKEHINYREDLEDLDMLLKQAKKVTKRIIESGYCHHCQKRKSAMEIPKQTVTIGRNTKATIVYLHVLLGLSYQEITEYLKTQYNLEISDGQITRSLEEQSDLLRPYYQNIFQALQQESGCHYDESSWDVQGNNREGNYVWVKTGTESRKTIFWFGRSRGKGVAEKLRGDISLEQIQNQVGISDDYGTYRTLFKYHALCWAHPHRKLRDLAESTTLEEPVRKHCQEVYESHAKLYKAVQAAKEKFDTGGYPDETARLKEIEKFKVEFDKITVPHNKDPDKLRCLKESLQVRKECYFTCLRIPNIPLDNNKAERALRKVVLKRRKCFGSRSQKGANVLSILYSVVFSVYWSYPSQDFFLHYQEALNLDEKEGQ
jgi:transposase